MMKKKEIKKKGRDSSKTVQQPNEISRMLKEDLFVRRKKRKGRKIS